MVKLTLWSLKMSDNSFSFSKYYLDKQFFPSGGGMFLNPFYFARSGLCEAMSKYAPMLSGRLLDVGCGSKPYQKLFSVDAYIGLDIDSEASRQRGIADHYYDGVLFPYSDASFDCILCNQVLEHVFNPEEFLGEMLRVLRPGGKLLMTVPFVWDEHEQPFDFARYSSFGLRALLERHGFHIVDQHKSIADIRVVFQLINAYIYKLTISSNKYLNILFMLFLMAPVNIAGEFLAKVLPKNKDLYLDNVILAKKVGNA